ncbi:unnamed protein product [Ascophyllum nodosum]
MSFGSVDVKSSDHVADIWQQPGMDTNTNRLKLELAETIYRSSNKEPLGKCYQRGHRLPKKVEVDSFMFGITSDKSESAKALLYSHPSDADIMQESKIKCGPSEQLRRGYKWDIDVKRHIFGRPGVHDTPLCLHNAAEPPRRLAQKTIEDFRDTQDILGHVKNLGHDSRDHLGKHVYGKKRGCDEWDARACVEGKYSWAEQQPDNDLGKAIMPGFRNTIVKDRAFGLPSIRSDIKPYAKRSVADTQNYGDESSMRYLVNPSHFSSLGIEDDEFFKSRGKNEIREIFESIGYSFSQEVFDSLWANVREKSCHDQEVESIANFQRSVNESLHAQDVEASFHAAIRG